MIAPKRTTVTQPAVFPRQTHNIIISDASAFAKRTYGGRNGGNVCECVCVCVTNMERNSDFFSFFFFNSNPSL